MAPFLFSELVPPFWFGLQGKPSGKQFCFGGGGVPTKTSRTTNSFPCFFLFVVGSVWDTGLVFA